MSTEVTEQIAGAEFSQCRNYRYALWRIWDQTKPRVMFIGLNPSKAGETEDDPTIQSVCRIAKYNGFGGVYMLNCWAYISTDPGGLKINPMTDEWNNNMLAVTAAKCSTVVFAWGNFKIVRKTGRDKEIIDMFPNAMALHVNKNGSPKHPLFVKGATKLIPYNTTKTD